MKIVDLSKPIIDNPDDPFFLRVKVKHKRHSISRWLVRYLGLPFNLFPKDFVGWADDTITKMGVHSTTHIDAPWHYGPTCNGEPAETIEAMPLEKCFAPGIVFDMTHKEDGEPITVHDLEKDLERTGAQLKPGTIALIHTGRDRYIRQKDYWQRGTGMTAASTEWLIEQGIEVMGIDQWGWDLPFHILIKRAIANRDNTLFWEAHLVGRKHRYWHMEQLCNLGALPAHGFKVCVFPLPLVGASAAPARVVALLDDDD